MSFNHLKTNYWAKWLLQGIILLSGVGMLYGVHRLDAAQTLFSECPVDVALVQSIVSDPSRNESQLIIDLCINGSPLVCASKDGRWYYSISDPESAKDPISITGHSVKGQNGQVRFALENPITADSLRTADETVLIAYTDTLFERIPIVCTTLPLMTIDYAGTLADDADVRIQMAICGNGISDGTIQSSGRMHIRGVSSKLVPKKSYKIELKYPGGSDNPLSFLDMRADDEWILDAGYYDPDKVRKYFCTNLWKKTCAGNNILQTDNGTEYRFVELILNGAYEGLYALGYPVDKKQLEIDTENKGELLYKKKLVFEEEDIDFTEKGPVRGYELRGKLNPTYTEEAAWEPLRDYYRRLFANQYDADTIRSLADTDNAIDLFLFFNLIQARDNALDNFSFRDVFIAMKQTDEGYRMIFTPWDMDLTWGIEPDDKIYRLSPSVNVLLYDRIVTALLNMDDEAAWSALNSRYLELRNSGWSESSLLNMLDEAECAVFDSGAYRREQLRWPAAAGDSDTTDLSKLKSHVTQRLIHMDRFMEQLNLLRKEGVLVKWLAQYENYMQLSYLIEIIDERAIQNVNVMQMLNFLGIDENEVQTLPCLITVESGERTHHVYHIGMEDGVEIETPIGRVSAINDQVELWGRDGYVVKLDDILCYTVYAHRDESIKMAIVGDEIHEFNLRQ